MNSKKTNENINTHATFRPADGIAVVEASKLVRQAETNAKQLGETPRVDQGNKTAPIS